MKPLITILITNYNTINFIKLNLYAIEKLTKNSFKVIINDNGSRDYDIKELKKLEMEKDYLKVNYRKSKYKEASYAHGEALDILIDMVDTPYFVILDSDCVFLMKDWDEYCLSKIDDKVKIVGTQIASVKGKGYKPDDFPFQFAVFVETKIYKSLNISCMPENTTDRDTCWQWKPKYNRGGYDSKLFYAKNTREFKGGPFKEVICAEYYTDENKLICCHFGRGSSGGKAKYKSIINYLPFIGKIYLDYKSLKETKQWMNICRRIIDEQNKL